MSASYPTTEDELLTAFLSLLEGLKQSANQANIDRRSLQQDFLTAQQLYQQQLLPTLMASPTATALMTYQTEINRALRLLGMDVSFLQTAKNPMTVQKRQAQMQQRLQTLLEFSRGLAAQLGKEPS
ncbi:MAG: heterocyst frequency control protein PatD [Leptolyngbyaceae cyanobacterium]